MRFRFLVIGLVAVVGLSAKNSNKLTRAEYIATYKDLAMTEMDRTGIPASITLAQGILESGDGNSRLAVKANNHFGIKCHDWKGPSMKHDDDKRNECFRKYKNAEQSYLDHSDFLTGTSRYASLFELDPDDYKSWAKGLKKAGYATSPTYAKALIGIIEDNNLQTFDQLVIAGKKDVKSPTTASVMGGRNVFFNNRVKYIVAKDGDTYSSLADELSLFDWQLPRYNEASINDSVKAGDYIYLQPKRNRSYGKLKTHMVEKGETLHEISQKYAIKLDKLRQRNNIPEDKEPAAGVVLVLRGKNNGKEIPLINSIKDKKDKEPIIEDEEEEFIIEYDLGG